MPASRSESPPAAPRVGLVPRAKPAGRATFLPTASVEGTAHPFRPKSLPEHVSAAFAATPSRHSQTSSKAEGAASSAAA